METTPQPGKQPTLRPPVTIIVNNPQELFTKGKQESTIEDVAGEFWKTQHTGAFDLESSNNDEEKQPENLLPTKIEDHHVDEIKTKVLQDWIKSNQKGDEILDNITPATQRIARIAQTMEQKEITWGIGKNKRKTQKMSHVEIIPQPREEIEQQYKTVDQILEQTREIHQELDAEKWESIADLIKRYEHMVAKHSADLGRSNLVQHEIWVTDPARTFYRQYPVPERYQEDFEETLRDNLTKGVIERCESPWGSPVVFAPKKRRRNTKMRRLQSPQQPYNLGSISNA